jgi:hypothetical protein
MWQTSRLEIEFHSLMTGSLLFCFHKDFFG